MEKESVQVWVFEITRVSLFCVSYLSDVASMLGPDVEYWSYIGTEFATNLLFKDFRSTSGCSQPKKVSEGRRNARARGYAAYVHLYSSFPLSLLCPNFLLSGRFAPRENRT